MKTMKKIVAILAAALMLCSILPLSAFAADATVVFTMGDDGAAGTHKDGNKYSNYTDTVGDYTLTLANLTNVYGPAIDAQGNGCIKLGTSSKTGGFSFTVPADVTSVIIAAGQYKKNASKLNVNGTAYTLTKASNNGEYDEIVIDTTSEKTVTLATVSGGVRAMINSITYVIAATNADCDHDSLQCGDTCGECEEYVKEHKFSNNCVAECENGCGEANPNYADHVYGGDYDAECDVCFAKREVNLPAADSELTIAQAIELGVGVGNNCYTEGKYYVTGEITEVYDTTYGNLYLTDGENTFTVYGLYDGNGTRYDAMAEKPVAGMTIKVYGTIGNYNGSAQMKNGDLIEATGGCEHEWDNDCDTNCNLDCGYEREPQHNYGDDTICDTCGAELPLEATITFDNKGKMTSSSDTEQVWEENGIVVNYAKGSYANNLAEYAAPVRFYKGTVVTIYYSGITSIEIVANTTSYATALGNSITGSVVNGKVVTYTLPAAADSFAITLSAQARVDSITVYGSAGGSDEECEHQWNAATCTAPATCALCGATDGEALGHTYAEDIINATCTANGTKTYECSVCDNSYDEAIPALGHTWGDTACETCGTEKPAGYAPITGADQLVSGQYVMVLETGYAPTYFDADSKWVLTGQPDSDSGLVLETAGYLWTLTVDGSSVTLTDANGVSIAPKGGNENGIKSGEYAWNWTFEDGYFVFAGVDTDTVYLASNTTAGSGDNKFRGYKQSTCTGNNAASYKYKFTLYLVAADEPACAHEYTYACDQTCALCGELTNEAAAHSIIAVEAKDATCNEKGNVAYWYCEYCGYAWADEALTQQTNQKAVVIPATGEHVYFDDCSAICEACGYEREVSHNVLHVEAVAPTCVAMGNVEYWYCDKCGMAWLDEACTLNTNLKAVKLSATGEHVYDDEYDADCNECGDVREVPEKPVDAIHGDANGDGSVNNKDVACLQQYLAQWDVELDDASADANGDGSVNNKDVARLQQYLAQWDVVLGPEE